MSNVLTKRSKKSLKKKKLLTNLHSSSESDGESSVHELSHYKNDKIKMMKEVLKVLNPKKIKSMAPDCIKHLDIEEINAMLLEELLGISNKRLGYIFNGEDPDRESSSSESEDERVAEVISLDDISDDDIEICIGPDDKNAVVEELDKRYKKKHKTKSKTKSIKSEKSEKSRKRAHHSSESNKKVTDDSNLMSVLELLELQARARAIRSQLALEAAQKKEKEAENSKVKLEEISDDDDDAVIVQSPKKDEIVIDSSDSDIEKESNQLESEKITNSNSNVSPHVNEESEKANENGEQKKVKQKVKIIRDWSIQNDTVIDNLQTKENSNTCMNKSDSQEQEIKTTQIDKENTSENLESTDHKENELQKISSPLSNEIEKDKENSGNEIREKMGGKPTETKDSHSECGDEIVINLDEEEMNEVEHS